MTVVATLFLLHNSMISFSLLEFIIKIALHTCIIVAYRREHQTLKHDNSNNDFVLATVTRVGR